MTIAHGGYSAAQRAEDWPVLGAIIERHRPSLVIELGTDRGGMSMWLADQVAPWGGRVASFDFTPRFGGVPGVAITVERVDLLGCGDADTKTDRELLAASRPHPRIVELTQAHDGPLLLYCDNGHKMTELRIYAPLLRVGDLCAVHDYGTEVDPAWSEETMAALGFTQEGHAEFEALHSADYLEPMTRAWLRREVLSPESLPDLPETVRGRFAT